MLTIDRKKLLTIKNLINDSSDEEKRYIASLFLSSFSSPVLGTNLCNQMMAKTPFIAYEGVLFRIREDGTIEVFLKRRSLEETESPGKLNLPGTLVRTRDGKMGILARLSREFGFEVIEECLVDIFYKVKPTDGKDDMWDSRGDLFHLLYLVKISKDASKEGWYQIDNLPNDLLHFHANLFIPRALIKFKETKGT